MSTILIAVLLVVPIIAVILGLNLSHKKQKQKADKRRSAYLYQVMQQTGITNNFQKELSHQLVILDEVNHKLLVIDHLDNTYSHTVYELNKIKGMEVKKVNQTVPGYENDKQTETVTSHIGLEIISGDVAQSRQLLVFYDHVKHNVYLMAEMETEAKQLQERIKDATKKRQLVTR